MNRFRSHPNHEHRPLYEGPLPWGLSEARRTKSFFKFLVTDPPRGRRQSSYLIDRVVTIPATYLNITSFVGKPHFIRSFSQTCSTDIASPGMRQRWGQANAKSTEECYENLFLSISPEPKNHSHDHGGDCARSLLPPLLMER
jgi:hypothetical protein